MGQYYNIIIKRKDQKSTHAYDRTLDGEYTMAKLTEHSWYLNPMVNAVAEKLYHNPSHIAWVGDYARGEEGDREDLYKLSHPASKKFEMLHKTEFTLKDRYLVNHTKKLILDCWDYLKESIKKNEDSSVMHPLPLLTALGNGRGGGDYRGINQEQIGSWAWDVLEIVEWEDLQPLKEDNYTFFSTRFEDR